MPGARLPLNITSLNKTIDYAIYNYKHNVIIFWGELGEGKTSLMLNALHRLIPDWRKVLSFILEPHKCLKCGLEYDANELYKFELMCPECGKKATETTSLTQALDLARKNWWVDPFPVDLRKGTIRTFPLGQRFIVCEGKGRGKITQVEPYLNFSFHEVQKTIQDTVYTRLRLPGMGWDDPSVYFHRSNIQYMHPEVKAFFSRYSFIRPYVANLFMAVPTIDFVPEQLSLFCTADVLLTERGLGDFDVKKSVRSFYGRQKSWQKSYDGRNVTWDKVPDEWFDAYEEIRHAHAVEAFEHPEEIFVTTMPSKGKEFTKEESLFS
jgi:hypothetical protein